MRTQEVGTGYEAGRGLSPEFDYADTGSWRSNLAFRTVRHKCALFIRYPVTQPKQTKTVWELSYSRTRVLKKKPILSPEYTVESELNVKLMHC